MQNREGELTGERLGQPHRILYIEKDKPVADESIKLLYRTAKALDLSISLANFVWQSYPPQKSDKLGNMLSEYTGGVLHNLSPRDLDEIIPFARKNPKFASRLVIVKTGGSSIDECASRYEVLSTLALNVMVIEKSELKSKRVSIVKRIFGVSEAK